MIPISNPPGLIIYLGNPVTIKGKYHILIKAQDSNDIERIKIYKFFIMSLMVVDLILGLPWLRTENPVINFKRLHWYYRIYRQDITLVITKQLKWDLRITLVAITLTLHVHQRSSETP